MSAERDLLARIMAETRTTQVNLARMTGIRQSSISQFLSGRINMSDEQLARVLAALGYKLEVTRTAVRPNLTRSEQRSWLLHRRVSAHLNSETFLDWLPKLNQNLDRLRVNLRGSLHHRNLKRWEELVTKGDINGLHRALTELDRPAIEMREVSPFSGLLADEERQSILAELRRVS